jgi:hypothetical protein
MPSARVMGNSPGNQDSRPAARTSCRDEGASPIGRILLRFIGAVEGCDETQLVRSG